MLAVTLLAGGPGYRSATVDDAGRLHIVMETGQEILPPKVEDQVSFGQPAISLDHRSVGWLVEYKDRSYEDGRTLSGKLVIQRDGQPLRTFTADQEFWDWQFQDGGKRVAFSDGPTHGGAAQCVLFDLVARRRVARWRVKQDGTPPAWARTLRY